MYTITIDNVEYHVDDRVQLFIETEGDFDIRLTQDDDAWNQMHDARARAIEARDTMERALSKQNDVNAELRDRVKELEEQLAYKDEQLARASMPRPSIYRNGHPLEELVDVTGETDLEDGTVMEDTDTYRIVEYSGWIEVDELGLEQAVAEIVEDQLRDEHGDIGDFSSNFFNNRLDYQFTITVQR